MESTSAFLRPVVEYGHGAPIVPAKKAEFQEALLVAPAFTRGFFVNTKFVDNSFSQKGGCLPRPTTHHMSSLRHILF